MLVAYAGLQAADAHSTLRAVAAGAVEANPSPVAQWAVRSAPRAYAVKAGVTAGMWWTLDRMACHRAQSNAWTAWNADEMRAAVDNS